MSPITQQQLVTETSFHFPVVYSLKRERSKKRRLRSGSTAPSPSSKRTRRTSDHNSSETSHPQHSESNTKSRIDLEMDSPAQSPELPQSPELKVRDISHPDRPPSTTPIPSTLIRDHPFDSLPKDPPDDTTNNIRCDPIDNLSLSSPNNDEEARIFAARIGDRWLDSIRSGSPAPPSIPSETDDNMESFYGKRTDSDTGSTFSKRPKPSSDYKLGTDEYEFVLRSCHIIREKGPLPPKLELLLESLLEPFDTAKRGFKHPVVLQRAMNVFLGQLDTSISDNEATFKNNIRPCYPFGFSVYMNQLMELRGVETLSMIPESSVFQDCSQQNIKTRHLASFTLPDHLKQPRPDSVMALRMSWANEILDKALLRVIPEASKMETARALISVEFVRTHILCDKAILFPHAIVEFKDIDKAAEADHQLRVGLAASIASGKTSIGEDIPIIGFTVNNANAQMYMGWSRMGGDDGGYTYREYVTKIVKTFSFSDTNDILAMQHAYYQVHHWAFTERRLVLEAKLQQYFEKQTIE
ncbi:serine/threonine protein kinase [Hypoxylon texense]